METTLLDQALALKGQIDYHDHLFYILNESEISDSEYDLLKIKFLGLLQDNPQLATEIEELSDDVKALALFESKSALKLVNHHRPFLSLRRTYDFNSYAFYKKLFGDSYIETKLDGVGIELIYHYGKLQHVLTKGSTQKGEDVTHNAPLFKNLPEYLPATKDIPVFDIRAEAHLTFDDIAHLKENGVKIVKQRNQVSGWIRSAEPTRSARGMITLSAYEVSPEVITAFKLASGMAMREWLTQQGFAVPALVSERDLLAHARNKECPFDGYIVKANLMSYRDKVDGRRDVPMSSMAFKYNTLFGESEVLDVVWSVNKNQIVPRLFYKEVIIDDSKCSYANLFNAGNFKRLKLGHGDKIRIVMGGDCVPHLESIVERSDHPRFALPTQCPCCKGPVSKIGPSLVCNDTEGCTDVLLTTLKKAVSKEGLDIHGLGPNTLEEWVGEGLVKKPLDLFQLEASQIPARFYNAIQASRRITLSRFIYVLNIDEIGAGAAAKLSEKLGTLENFLAFLADHERIKATLPPAKALSLLKVVNDKSCMRYIERLAAAMTVRPDVQKVVTIPVVLTGVFDSPRNVMAELLLKSGIEVVPRVSKNVKCVIVGARDNDTETNSMKEARRLGIVLLHVTRDTEFNQIIKEIKAL